MGRAIESKIPVITTLAMDLRRPRLTLEMQSMFAWRCVGQQRSEYDCIKVLVNQS
jgi:hypothetical protein